MGEERATFADPCDFLEDLDAPEGQTRCLLLEALGPDSEMARELGLGEGCTATLDMRIAQQVGEVKV